MSTKETLDLQKLKELAKKLVKEVFSARTPDWLVDPLTKVGKLLGIKDGTIVVRESDQVKVYYVKDNALVVLLTAVASLSVPEGDDVKLVATIKCNDNDITKLVSATETSFTLVFDMVRNETKLTLQE